MTATYGEEIQGALCGVSGQKEQTAIAFQALTTQVAAAVTAAATVAEVACQEAGDC